jgi:hypothetical protein
VLEKIGQVILSVLFTALIFSVTLMGGSLWWGVLTDPVRPIAGDSTPQPFPFDRKWNIYGGAGRRDFLGCLTCFTETENSIFLLDLPHGGPSQPLSIANAGGPYGTPHGRYSACDSAATDPPVLVDESGHVAGMVTLNRSLPERISNPWINERIQHLCAPLPK